jgi:hypothetical protein
MARQSAHAQPRGRRARFPALVVLLFAVVVGVVGCSGGGDEADVDGTDMTVPAVQGGESTGSTVELPVASPDGPTTTVVISFPDTTAPPEPAPVREATLPTTPETTGPPQGEIDLGD